MKKLFLNAFLITFVTFGFAGQSWAMGHHHGEGGSSQVTSTGSSGSDGTTVTGATVPPSGNQGTVSNDPSSSSDPVPASPVPEPLTLSLLGAGLGGLYLKRRMDRHQI